MLSLEDFGPSLEGFGWLSVWVSRPQVTFGIFGCLRLVFRITTREVINHCSEVISYHISVVLSYHFTCINFIHGFNLSHGYPPWICNNIHL